MILLSNTGTKDSIVYPTLSSVWFQEAYSGTGTSSKLITPGFNPIGSLLLNRGYSGSIDSNNSTIVHHLNSFSSNLTLYSNTIDSLISVGGTISTTSTQVSLSSIRNSHSYLFSNYLFQQANRWFKVVNWTGNDNTSGGTARLITHGLGETPGMIWIKNLTTNNDWIVWHVGAPTLNGILNLETLFFSTNKPIDAVNSTSFSITKRYSSDTRSNNQGHSYVAFIWADNTAAGNIRNGNFNGGSSITTVDVGFPIGWLMVKRSSGSSGSSGWWIVDDQRGFTPTIGSRISLSDTSPVSESNIITTSGTSFTVGTSVISGTYVWTAIRKL